MNQTTINKLSLYLLIFLLGGCSLFTSKEKTRSLANLEPAILLDDQAAPRVDTQAMIKQYRQLLEVSSDPEARVVAQYRLAGLGMILNEDALNQDPSNGEGDNPQLVDGIDYDQVINDYENLLVTYPERENNDELLYQLAKALDIQGRTDESLTRLTELVTRFPNSQYFVEAQFRRGDLLFSRKRYVGSGKAFEDVIAAGKNTPFYLNSLYMRSWTQFKLAKYTLSLPSFALLLDELFAGKESLKDLDKGYKALADDTLRVMAITFSYQDLRPLGNGAVPANWCKILPTPTVSTTRQVSFRHRASRRLSPGV